MGSGLGFRDWDWDGDGDMDGGVPCGFGQGLMGLFTGHRYQEAEVQQVPVDEGCGSQVQEEPQTCSARDHEGFGEYSRKQSWGGGPAQTAVGDEG